MSGEFIGTDPEYRMESRAPRDEPTEAGKAVLEHEELCRREPPKLDWRGNPVEEFSDEFDLSEHPVEEVQEHIEANPEEADAVLAEDDDS